MDNFFPNKYNITCLYSWRFTMYIHNTHPYSLPTSSFYHLPPPFYLLHINLPVSILLPPMYSFSSPIHSYSSQIFYQFPSCFPSFRAFPGSVVPQPFPFYLLRHLFYICFLILPLAGRILFLPFPLSSHLTVQISSHALLLVYL